MKTMLKMALKAVLSRFCLRLGLCSGLGSSLRPGLRPGLCLSSRLNLRMGLSPSLALVLFLFFAHPAYADAFTYTAQEFLADCKSAEALFVGKPGGKLDVPVSLAGTRCLSYLQGFIGGYEISETLARRIGVEYIAFCLPPDIDAPGLLRAVENYQNPRPLPPENLVAIPAHRLVIAALAHSFACESEQKLTDNPPSP